MNNKDSKKKKPPGKRRKQRKSADGHRMTESYKLLDEIMVFRTTKSGPYWSMSFWLQKEKKAYRRSLRTKNLDDAKSLAKRQYFKLMADAEAGRTIFPKKAKELVAEYIKYKAAEADADHISQGRVKTVTTSLKWFLKFVNEDKGIDKINSNDFKTYHTWRREQAKNVKRVTLDLLRK